MSLLPFMILGLFVIAGLILCGGLLLWLGTSSGMQRYIKRRSDHLKNRQVGRRGFEVLGKK